MLCSLLNDWNYFWNKYCNLPFLSVPHFPFWYFLRHPDIKKHKLGCEWACKTKKRLIVILNYRTTVIKVQLFSLTALKCFFSFLIKAFADFVKLIKFHSKVFFVYKNGENLKILIEIFWQKLIISDIVLVFLDHLKPKIFFVGQPSWPT